MADGAGVGAHHPTLVLGVLAALAATLLASTGLVLQALDARTIDRRHGLRLSLVRRLLRQRRWMLGTLVVYTSFPLELLALAHAPLVVVEPLHAGGLLVVIAAGARWLGERVGRGALAAATAIVGGIAIVAWGAPPGPNAEVSQPLYAGVTAAVLAFSLLPFALGDRCGRLTLLLCAGAGVAAVNLAVKGFSDHLRAEQYVAAAGYLSLAAAGAAGGLLTQATAFGRIRAVDVVPVTFAIANFLPVLLALLILRERWAAAAGAGVPFAVGTIVLLAGSVAAGRTRAVAGVVERAAG